MRKRKWYVYLKGGYFCTTTATLTEIKVAFPYATILGNTVNVYAMTKH